MTDDATALDDARVIAQGIRHGGSAEIIAALEAADAEGPLTPDGIEQVAHPDWDRLRFEEIRQVPPPGDVEAVGLAHLHELPRGGHVVAADGIGWVPGAYASRATALLAYGYFLGGEGAGPLAELRARAVAEGRRLIEAAELAAFVQRDGTGAVVKFPKHP
ncbi:hypothetical protein [Streptomyces chryseus]|uniref:Uncharacterized protein n=1 Tax=Streptomyces chryseus TaxID=68186 RepID=A0ABQ3DH04_9ACTN|nr:hypothetical protein [Streptomyces chryseus]GGX37642.1 hypothetical protein GCM10010353_61280 [Streptomyces chryseus]GHA94585.1 hypothetical protein GCM10010346_16710 [Streptomyces chryseus]